MSLRLTAYYKRNPAAATTPGYATASEAGADNAETQVAPNMTKFANALKIIPGEAMIFFAFTRSQGVNNEFQWAYEAAAGFGAIVITFVLRYVLLRGRFRPQAAALFTSLVCITLWVFAQGGTLFVTAAPALHALFYCLVILAALVGGALIPPDREID